MQHNIFCYCQCRHECEGTMHKLRSSQKIMVSSHFFISSSPSYFLLSLFAIIMSRYCCSIMKVCWPSRSAVSTSLSGSWRYREGIWRRKRWMRWWPQENGRSSMRTCWMMPESHGHNYRRLNSDTRYGKAILHDWLYFVNAIPFRYIGVQVISLEGTIVLSFVCCMLWFLERFWWSSNTNLKVIALPLCLLFNTY